MACRAAFVQTASAAARRQWRTAACVRGGLAAGSLGSLVACQGRVEGVLACATPARSCGRLQQLVRRVLTLDWP